MEQTHANRDGLLAAQDLLPEILGRIPDGFSIIDHDWRLVYMNPASDALIRRLVAAPDALVGQVIWDALPALRGSRFEQAYRQARETRAPVEIEDYYPPLDAWFQVRIYPTETHLLAYSHEITERRRAEAEREELANYNRTLLESAGDGLYGLDAGGRCTFLNPAGKAMLGLEGDDFLGQTLHSRIHHTYPDGTPFPEEECPIFQTVQDGVPRRVEDDYFYRPDGSPVRVEYAVFPVQGAGGAVVRFSDIRQRKDAERALQESEERFRALADNISQLAWMASADGSIFWYNRRWYDYTGTTLDEMIGWGWQKVHHPDYVGPVTDKFRAHVERGQNWEDTFPLRGADGVFRWFLSRAAPVRDAEGGILLWCGTNTDITDQLQMEKALRQSEQRYKALVDATRQIVWTNSPEGEMRGDQPGWASLTGQTEEEYQGYGWAQAVHPDDASPTVEAWGECVRDRKPFLWEHRVRRFDGEWRLFSIRAVPILEDDGRIREWVGIHTDITEQRAAERERQALQERYRSLVDAIAQIVWTTPPSGEFEEEQPGWAQFTGRGFDVLRGRGWLETVHPDDREHIEALWSYALATGTPFEAEHRLQRHDGMYRYMAARAVPVTNPDGSVREWVGIHTDITHRRQAEEELRLARDAAETANRTKSLFLANMSHELRTPLNAILGYSEILQEEAEDRGLDVFRPDLEKIHKAGRHLLSLINDVLDLAKIESGKMDLFYEDIGVADLVQETAVTVAPLAQQNGDSFQIDCPETLGRMRVDVTKLRQCLLNLLSNACKFTQGGQVSLTVRRLPGRLERLEFTVADTGIGMTPEQQGRLFEVFTQADGQTTRRYGGTGLGLALTRRMVELMGGEISVVSQAGAGSSFTLRVPAGPPTQAERIAESEDSAGPSGRRVVLVVDDDPAARDLIARFLSREGMTVRTASDGEEGLRLARELRPAVITLDVMMPGLDGWAVLSRLKADPELADIPVVLLTMVNDPGMGYRLGAADYLTKPIDRRRLSSVIRKYRCGAEPCGALVVDDDALTRRMMRAVLERDAWAVREAADGEEALRAMGERAPDLILLDLLMPGMDGFEVTDRLRENPEWNGIPVIILTAKDVTEEDRKRLNGRVQKILQKGRADQGALLEDLRQVVLTAPQEKA